MGRKPAPFSTTASPPRPSPGRGCGTMAGGLASPPYPCTPTTRRGRALAAAGVALVGLLAVGGLPTGAWGGETAEGAGTTLVTSHGGRFPVSTASVSDGLHTVGCRV